MIRKNPSKLKVLDVFSDFLGLDRFVRKVLGPQNLDQTFSIMLLY